MNQQKITFSDLKRDVIVHVGEARICARWRGHGRGGWTRRRGGWSLLLRRCRRGAARRFVAALLLWRLLLSTAAVATIVMAAVEGTENTSAGDPQVVRQEISSTFLRMAVNIFG